MFLCINLQGHRMNKSIPKISLTMHIPRDLHKRLKIQAAKNEESMTALVIDILATHLNGEKHD